MALKLNNYKTITEVVAISPTVVYTAPTGYTGVVLLGQIANISSTSYDVTLLHRRGGIDTEIVKDFPIAGNDTINLISGKLFLETGDQLVLSGSDATNLKFISSILETLN
jgi:hypothetical protein